MKYNTLRIIRRLLKNELECALKDFDAQDWQ